MKAAELVDQLLCVHMGLVDPNDNNNSGGINDNTHPKIRDFRDLYQFPLHALHQKRELLRAAEETCCTGVILDVLLYLSQTMTPALFHKELAANTPIAMSQWINYVWEQCIVTNEIVSLYALQGMLELYSSTKRYQDLATLLLVQISKQWHIQKAVRVAKEVVDIAKHYRHQFPAWSLEFLNEFIELTELQIVTELQDTDTAPEPQVKDGYMDKRSRGTTNLQANWRRRYVQLSSNELIYSKHDVDKISTSKNPFLDRRKKGSLTLSKGLRVVPLNYAGKFSIRPYCVQIGDGDHALILDTCTPETQRLWIEALTANIKRLGMDPVWVKFPRRCVHRMTVNEFLRYCLLYHNNDKRKDNHPLKLRDRFHIDDKRFFYSSMVNAARVKDWQQLEEYAKAPKLNLSVFSSSAGDFDPAVLGYGAIFDIADQGQAPPSLLMTLEALHQKHDAKFPGAWSCRKDVDENATLSIRIDVPASVRAENSGH